MSCDLKYRFARQNAKNRLIKSGAINQYNEILDRPKVISHMNLFRDYAKNNYGIKADFLLFEDTNQASKVIFNDSAFRAVDVIKGVNKDKFHDFATAEYLRNREVSEERVLFDPAFDSMFDSDTPFETPPTGGLTKLVTLKSNLLSNARQRLSEVKPLLKVNKDNEAKYTELIKLQNELKDYISGNESRGIKGLEAEIEELSKLDSRAPEYIAPFVEKELNRLSRLIQSQEASASKEAQQIIDFIKVIGTFNPLVEHPFFHKSEVFDEEGNLLLTDAMVKPFMEWAERATVLERELSFNNKKIIEEKFNNNSNIKELYEGRKFSYEEIVNSKDGLKDANWVDMMFMDVTSGIFSTNGLMPQVIKQAVDTKLEEQYAWAKEIQEKINNLTPQVQEELRRLGYGLNNLGLIGIKAVSYDLFSQKFDNDGSQKTGNIVHKYSNKWFEDRGEMNTKFWQAIADAKVLDDDTVKRFAYKQAFDNRNAWFKKNTQLINPALISSIINNPAFASLSSNFTYSQAEIDAHEQMLESIVGKDHLDKVIGAQETKLKQYMVQRTIAVKEILDSEGKTSEVDLSEKGQRSVQAWEAEHNPFIAVTYRETGNATRVGSNEYHAKFDYNDYLPLAEVDGKTSNYYDSNYSKIEENPILKEFYDVIYGATSEMKSKLPFDVQEKMLSTSIPNMEKSIIELILDKDLDFMQAISEVFRRMIESIKGLFGIKEQDQFSYAKTDPITGLPNYQVNDTFIAQNLDKINNLFFIRKTAFQSEFNKLSVKQMRNISKFKAIPVTALTPQIAALISRYTGVNQSVLELAAQYGTTIPVGKILYRNAQHEVAQEKSFDLPKVIKLYTHLTAQYVARQEVLPLVELMKSHYEQIKNQVTNNTDKAVYNLAFGSDKSKAQNRLKGVRTNANAQFDDWFERVVLGNYGLKKHYGLFSKDKKIYDSAEKDLIAEIDEAIKNTQDEKVLEKLNEIKAKLGKKLAVSAIIDALFRFIRGVGLGFNLSSALTNFVEGQSANSVVAATGEDFNPEFLHEVSPTDMIFADFIKQADMGAIPQKVAKAYYIAKYADVLQDNTNELQKASAGSGFSVNKLNLFYITTKPEHYNQMPLMVATLKAKAITGANGEVSNVWDAMEATYDPKSKQWTASLKPEFATEENKASWQNFNGQDYFSWKSKIRQVIKNTHGNFEQTGGMKAKSSHVGQAFTFYKTWLPTELYKRFAMPQTDLALKRDFKGRYRSFTPVTAAIHGAVVGSFFLGPIGAIAGASGGLILQNILGIKSGLSTIEELGLVSKLLFKKMVGMPINLVGSLAGQNRIIKTNLADEVYDKMQNSGKYEFTQRDFRNYRANMQELALMLTWFGLLLAAKGATWDDDDKQDDPRRMLHNLLANRFMQLGSSAMMYLNPYTLFQETMLELPVFRFFESVGKTIGAASKALEGEDTLLTGVNAGESRTLNQLQKTFLPGMFSQKFLGFEKATERQFVPSPYDSYFYGDEKVAQREIKEKKAEKRSELQEQGMAEEDIDKLINKEFPRRKKGQKYQELLEQLEATEE